MKAATYIRVSTGEQAGEDRYGLRTQKAEIARLVRQKHYEVVKEYSDTMSGARSDRPGLQEMLTDAKEHRFEVLIVSKLDRLARSLVVELQAIDELKADGVTVMSIAEPTGGQDPDTERLIHSVSGAVAEWEKHRIAKRMAAARRVKAEEGGYAGAKPQYGYIHLNKRLVVEPDQAEVVRQVFELREQRWTLRAIAAKLNQEGKRTRRGKEWKSPQILRILRHKPLYRGRYQYTDIVVAKGQHQPIL